MLNAGKELSMFCVCEVICPGACFFEKLDFIDFTLFWCCQNSALVLPVFCKNKNYITNTSWDTLVLNLTFSWVTVNNVSEGSESIQGSSAVLVLITFKGSTFTWLRWCSVVNRGAAWVTQRNNARGKDVNWCWKVRDLMLVNIVNSWFWHVFVVSVFRWVWLNFFIYCCMAV